MENQRKMLYEYCEDAFGIMSIYPYKFKRDEKNE